MATVYTYGVGPTGYTDGTTSTPWQHDNFPYGGKLTFAEAGTVDQLGAYLSNQDAGQAWGVKFALFDSSSNLVADFSLTSMSAAQAMGWVDSPVHGTPPSVSAADYYPMTIAQDATILMGYDTANDGSFGANVGYANVWASSDMVVGGQDAEAGLGYGRRANFTASAGGLGIPIAAYHHFHHNLG